MCVFTLVCIRLGRKIINIWRNILARFDAGTLRHDFQLHHVQEPSVFKSLFLSVNCSLYKYLTESAQQAQRHKAWPQLGTQQ